MLRLASVCALVVLASAASASAQTHPAVTELRAYQQASIGRDGDAAARRVTAATIRFYDRCRRMALTMPEAALRAEPGLARLTTLSLRIDHTAAQLRRMDGRDVLASMIDDGQVSGLDGVVVGDVHPGAQVTRIAVRRESGAHLGTVTMRLEEGAWRLDLVALMAEANAMLDRPASRGALGGRDTALMLALALMHRGERPSNTDIWIPLERR